MNAIDKTLDTLTKLACACGEQPGLLADLDLVSKFEEGKPADPTENMSPEDAAKWKAMNDEHKDKFKSASKADVVEPLVHLLRGLPGVARANVNDFRDDGYAIDVEVMVWAAVPKDKDVDYTTKITPGRIANTLKAAVTKWAKSQSFEVRFTEFATPLQDFGPIKPDGVDPWTEQRKVSPLAIANFYRKNPFRFSLYIYTGGLQKSAGDLDSLMANLEGLVAEGCPDNLDDVACKEWEANTEKYKDVVKDQSMVVNGKLQCDMVKGYNEPVTRKLKLAEIAKWREDASSPGEMDDLDESWQEVLRGDLSLQDLKDNPPEKEASLEIEARFTEGESVDVAEYLRGHGNPEAAEAWEAMNEEHGDKFKTAATLSDKHAATLSDKHKKSLSETSKDRGMTEAEVLKLWDAEKPHFGGGMPHRFENGVCIYCRRPKDYEPGKGKKASEEKEPEVPGRDGKKTGNLPDQFVDMWAAVVEDGRLIGATDNVRGASPSFWGPEYRGSNNPAIYHLAGVPEQVALRLADFGTPVQRYVDGYEAWEVAKRYVDEPIKGFHRAASDSAFEAEWFGNKTAAVPNGLYGFPKGIQSSCESAARKLARTASKLAKMAYGKDERVADFLGIHAKRSKSTAAKILAAAMNDLGPKIVLEEDEPEDQQEKQAADQVDAVLKVVREKAKIPVGKVPAKSKMKEVVEALKAETKDKDVASKVFNALFKGSDPDDFDAAWGKSAKKAAGSGSSNAKYLAGLTPQAKEKILRAVAKHYGVSVPEIEVELTDRDAEALYEYLSFDHGLAMQVSRDFQKMRLAKANYGLYGYPDKVSSLGLTACSTLMEEAGRVAADLHRRKADHHERISGFLGEHCKQAKCLYSRLLLDAYPDASMRLASVVPATVDEWLKWADDDEDEGAEPEGQNQKEAGFSYATDNGWFAFVGNKTPFNIDTIREINQMAITFLDDEGEAHEGVGLNVVNTKHSPPLTFYQEKAGQMREIIVQVRYPAGALRSVTRALTDLGKRLKFKVEYLPRPREPQTRSTK